MTHPLDRAVSAVIGAIILFGFLAIAFTLYQGIVVPNQLAAIELEHNEQVRAAVQELRNAIRTVGTDGPEDPVSISLGASYPPGVFRINPGTAAGSLSTDPLGAITVWNVSATDAETAEYIGDSNTTLGPFETRAIVHRPSYLYYEPAPTIRAEHSVAYSRFPNGKQSLLTDQVIIDGREITLIALVGNLSLARSGSVTVDPVALSPASEPVALTNASGPIRLSLPSQLSPAVWTDLLREEYDPNGTASDRYVRAIRSTGSEEVSIVLEPGVSYEFELAKVGVGTGGAVPAPRYIMAVAGDETGLPEEGQRQLVVEVRDRYNNPVSNVSVQATIATPANASDPAEGISPATEITDPAGWAAFTYSAPHVVHEPRTATIELTFAGGTEPTQTAVVEITVLDIDGSG